MQSGVTVVVYHTNRQPHSGASSRQALQGAVIRYSNGPWLQALTSFTSSPVWDSSHPAIPAYAGLTPRHGVDVSAPRRCPFKDRDGARVSNKDSHLFPLGLTPKYPQKYLQMCRYLMDTGEHPWTRHMPKLLKLWYFYTSIDVNGWAFGARKTLGFETPTMKFQACTEVASRQP